ncbi:hypothetical protein FCV25MIE_05471 [Fagus crenata]
MDFKIRALWKPQRDLQCIDLGLDFFLVRFKLSEDYWNVVNNGPWFIRQQFLSVQRKISTTAVWARLPELPIELYDSNLLQHNGNQLGTLLKIDACTVDNIHGRFARLCGQIDLEQPLTPKVKVGHITQRIQYEGISSICFVCGCVSHRKEFCPSITPPLKPTIIKDPAPT